MKVRLYEYILKKGWRMDTAVSMKNITKTFGKTVANNDVCLDIYKGEILSLLGENGSGKTTLMNMLSGIYYPDSGQIFIDGKEVSIKNPRDAHRLHIGMVHQHFKLVDVLSAVENIILGMPGKLNIKDACARIKEICDKYGFDIDPMQKIYDMSVSQKQTVEIVKVLFKGANILILDEPTAVLTPQESDRLFDVMRNMKADGKSIIIITHKLSEVMAISDRVAILRKGEYIGSLNTSETNPQEMTNMMVGRSVELNIERKEPVNPQTRVEIKGLCVKNEEGLDRLKDISFDIRSGEILGVAGISGCGEKELLEAIAGLQKIEAGSIIYTDEADNRIELSGKGPKEIRDLGILLSFVPEDRLGMGLVSDMGMTENMMLRSYEMGGKIPGFTNRSEPTSLAKKLINYLEIVTPSVATPVRKLSGGNVQKVLVGREISSSPKVLLTAYAVRGLDINSAYTIYDLINQEKEKGSAVVFVGEDLDVLLELCDRILVLCDGEVSGILDGRTTSKEEVGLLMTSLGGNSHE